jgi:hypothetical protein
MPGAVGIKATLKNQTDKTMTRVGEPAINSGAKYTSEPPSTIKPGSEGSWSAEETGLLTGVTGSVEYALDGVDGHARFEWHVPTIGTRVYGHSAPEGYVTDRSEGAGDDSHPRVNFYIKKRP